MREKGVVPQPGRSFRPAWWLPGAHAQTIAGRLWRRRPVPPLRRERLATPDGDFLDIDFTASVGLPAVPVVLLLHGLEGSSRRGYALSLYRELEARGIGVAGLNFRGCGGEPNRTARSYHSGETGDPGFVIAWLRARLPGSPLGAIGFSLGGNVLLKYLGEQGTAAAAMLRACVTVSVPFDLGACADALAATRIGRFYTRRFLATLKDKVARKSEMLADRIDLRLAAGSRSFREFDDAVTAPLHGFASAEDYYTRCSSARFVSAVRTPVLLLQAEDDPFLPPGAIPRAAINRNPALMPAFTARGGHVGFIEGPPWRPRFWAGREAAAFLADRLLDGAEPRG